MIHFEFHYMNFDEKQFYVSAVLETQAVKDSLASVLLRQVWNDKTHSINLLFPLVFLQQNILRYSTTIYHVFGIITRKITKPTCYYLKYCYLAELLVNASENCNCNSFNRNSSADWTVTGNRLFLFAGYGSIRGEKRSKQRISVRPFQVSGSGVWRMKIIRRRMKCIHWNVLSTITHLTEPYFSSICSVPR